MRAEQIYGFALSAYPRRWRERRGAEVLGVLMDAAADRGTKRPGVREVGNLIVHGIAERIRTATEPIGQGMRNLTARLALSSLVVLLTLTVAFGEVWSWDRPGTTPYSGPATAYDGTFGPFFTAGGPVMTLALLVCLVGLLGRTRVLRPALPVCAIVLAATSAASPVVGLNRPAVWTVLGVTVLAGFVWLGDATPSRRWATWTLAGTAAGVAEVWIRWVRFVDDPRPFFYYQRIGDTTATWALLLLLTAVVAAVMRRRLLGILPVAIAWLLILALQQHSGGQPRGALAFGGLAAFCFAAGTGALAVRHYVSFVEKRAMATPSN